MIDLKTPWEFDPDTDNPPEMTIYDIDNDQLKEMVHRVNTHDGLLAAFKSLAMAYVGVSEFYAAHVGGEWNPTEDVNYQAALAAIKEAEKAQ